MTSFAVVHDQAGPKVRLGVAWFVGVTAACVASPLVLATVMAVAAAFAADQIVRLHAPTSAPTLLEDQLRLVAIVLAAGLPLAASQGADTLTAAIAFGVILSVAAVSARAPLPMFSALAVGLAAASPVLLQRLGMAAALLLLALVAAYDAGDFIIGTSSSVPWEGPAAGIAAVAVVGFGAVVLAPPPLQEQGAAVLAFLVALLAPLGPIVGSALIGDGVTPARFVRRLDSLLLAGPIAAYVLEAYLPKL